MLYRLGGLMVTLRWWVIAFWVVVFAISLPFAPRVTSALKSGFGDVDTESRIALRLMTERMGIPESSVTLVFSSDDLVVTDARYVQEVDKTLAPLADLPQVAGVVTFYNTGNPDMVSSDGRATYAFVQLNTDIDASVDLFPKIRDRLQPFQT